MREEGFLLIDLFPYTAKFNKVHGRKAYKELIDLSVEHDLPKLLQLLDDKLNKDVKVAFAMKRFGHHKNRVLEKHDGVKGYDIFSKDKLNWKLENIAGKTYRNKDNNVIKRLSCYENVIADQSGNPNPSLIRYSFKLN